MDAIGIIWSVVRMPMPWPHPRESDLTDREYGSGFEIVETPLCDF
jgi:hypothetical protein